MSQFKHYLDTSVTGKHVLVLSVLSLAFLGLFFGLAFSDIPTNTLLDTRFNFSAVQVHTVLDSYSLTMMKHYGRAESIDLVGMVLVCMTQASIIVYACRQWVWAQLASAVPLGAMAFNTIKDLFMLGIINAYPHESTVIVQFTNSMNMIKTVLVDCSFLLVFVALGLIMVCFLRRRVWLTASS